VVLGGPNAAAREILDRLGATYYVPWGGFSRFYFGGSEEAPGGRPELPSVGERHLRLD
jgi:hypothetical protein